MQNIMASKGENCFGRISCCVITGASRGLGKSIALKFAAKLPAKSVFILLSRDTESLSDVKREISLINQEAKTITKEFDQSVLNQSNFDSLFKDIFHENGLSVSDFEQAVMIHNAGSLGDISKYAEELTDAKTVQDTFDINVSGMILLNSAFLQLFKKELIQHRIVINISSLAGIQPFKSWSLYCTGKAARDMFFRVLALEYPDIRVLNYAPGPCDTDMQKKCREETGDPEVKNMFISLHEKKGLIDCDTSISKLLQILENDAYENGAHVDFYD